MDGSYGVKSLAQAEFAEHLLDRRLSVALNVYHVGLHIDESVFLDQIVKKLDATVVSSNLSLEVSNIVFQVSCSSDEWVDIFGLICQDVGQFSFIEHSIFDDLESYELSTLFINMLRKGRHGARLDATNI